MNDSEDGASSLERPTSAPSTGDLSGENEAAATTPPGTPSSGEEAPVAGAQAEATDGPDGPDEADESEEDQHHEGSTLERPEDGVFYAKRGSRKRRPKYGRFGGIGGLIGLIGGLVLAQVGPVSAGQDYTRVDLSIVLVGLGVPVGILLGLTIALFLDRRRR